MKTTLKALLLPALLLPLGLSAQSTTTTTTSTTYSAPGEYEWAGAGDFEFTLGGGGSSNTDLDNSSGNVNFSVGYYLNDTLEVVARQGIGYNNPNSDGSSFAGLTRIALDQHLAPSGRFRPFIGVNAGAVYGDAVEESFTAGLEAGVKIYVHPKTFIFAMADYSWYFEDSDDADDAFDDGAYGWTVGIGFNF